MTHAGVQNVIFQRALCHVAWLKSRWFNICVS